MSRRTETAYKAWFPGKSAQHDKAQDSREQGKYSGCVVTDHVLIWGDLLDRRWIGISDPVSREMTGWGDRYTKSW
jgi:hypothetical protein